MTCPVCGDKTSVTATATMCDMIIRQRKCHTCDHIFYTKEIDYENSKEASDLLFKERYKAKMLSKKGIIK